MKKIVVSLIAIALTLAVFSGCSGSYPGGGDDGWGDYIPNQEYEYGQGDSEYERFIENAFEIPDPARPATFSLDANTAAYAQARSYLNGGSQVPRDLVRIEEFINYFNYPSYPLPEEGEAVRLNYNILPCPWNTANKLVRVGVRTEDVAFDERPNNLIFLIDVSGSMAGAQRLGLVQTGFAMLVRNLTERDTVSIVTYASGTKVHLSGASGNDQKRIISVIDHLQASGSTAGASGIREAYRIAQENFKQAGNNRIILATDGDFNMGMSGPEELQEFVQEKYDDTGVSLSVFGFGMGNTKDNRMKNIAEAGHGFYGYIDSEQEARKNLVENLNGTLRTVAEDAKAGVTFAPESVKKYRLIGYDTKRISMEEYNDPNANAGTIGSGLEVTALFEIVPAATFAGNIGHAEVRYNLPAQAGSKSLDLKTGETAAEGRRTSDSELVRSETRSLALSVEGAAPAGKDDVFVTCAAEFGLLLLRSDYRGNASFDAVLSRLVELDLSDDLYKQDFVSLVRRAKDVY